MPLVINTNIGSLNAQRNLNSSQDMLSTALERLSSGLRINSAKDDAAGLAISARMTSQINGLQQAVRNANDGISFAQTAEGALNEVGKAFQRIRELSVQSANDTNTASDRQAINNEVSALIAEVNRIAQSTQFNGQNVLDGTLQDLVFQVGANRGQTITVNGVDARGSVLGAAVATGSSIAASDIATLADITVQGVSVDLSAATTVEDVIGAINNASADSGVSAVQANTTTAQDLAYTAPTGTAVANVEINGVSMSLDATSGSTVQAAVDVINQFSEQTGVTAAVDGAAIDLSNSTGGSIEVTTDTAGVLAAAAGTETYFAGIELAADVGTTVTVAGTDATNLALNGVTSTDFTTNGISVLTRDSASEAIRTVDYALQQVNGLRAELGATQSRFESVISNLSIGVENLSAARSRIRDADFAAETARLTKAQILQQAGVSVLSQANALPQTALALLQ
ncbi:MAG: flagellin [Nitrococcus sp.]|nr:flagellin [Nitrococcus sp.]